MILTPDILTIFILNSILFLFAMLAFILSIKIFLKWDTNATTKLQYKLEKQSFLTATIIKYIFAIKIPLFLFLIFTLDKISDLITGAMCAAGVVNATQWGTYLIIIKILNLYLFGYWLVIHYIDIKKEDLPYTKLKFGFFIGAFFLFFIEISLEFLMFSSLNVNKMVSCCGTLYSSASTSYISNIFLIKTPLLLSLFYGNFIIIALLYFLRKKINLFNKQLFALSNFFFIIISLISLIVFFGTYIYELPTHHCPFCFLQKDYYYVGYLIYTLLFLGTFNGIIVGFINDNIIEQKKYKISLIFDTLYTLLVTAYPIGYYIKNGVWLY